jgi:transcriptional regulator with XRE-family HTH domain
MGISQEILAEQLAVSRQAVSKWESDTTIPEIDKIIALGKLILTAETVNGIYDKTQSY